MTDVVRALGVARDALWELACLLFAGVTLALIVGFWAMVLFGLGAAFKHWRLYSKHRLAKRIRRWLTRRRQDARIRKAKRAQMNAELAL